jgi:AraC-like DNA-binding protein
MSRTVPRARQLLQRANDPGYVREIVSGNIVPHTLSVARGASLDARLRRLHQGTISVYTLSYGAPVELRVDPSGRGYIVLLSGGEGGSLATGSGVVPLTPAIITPGTRATLRWPADADVTVIRVSRTMMDAAARIDRGAPLAGSIAFEPHLDPAHDKAGPWLSLAATFVDALETGSITGSPVAMTHFERLLVHGLFAVQPNSGRTAADSLRGTMPNSLEAALAFCDRHHGIPPTVDEIAAAAHVSRRTLQSQFRLYLGTTPLGYLREVRLARVHADLLAAAVRRGSATVTDIANRHGFHHMGRFAVQYRATYGRTPSETLHTGLAEMSAAEAAPAEEPPATRRPPLVANRSARPLSPAWR